MCMMLCMHYVYIHVYYRRFKQAAQKAGLRRTSTFENFVSLQHKYTHPLTHTHTHSQTHSTQHTHMHIHARAYITRGTSIHYSWLYAYAYIHNTRTCMYTRKYTSTVLPLAFTDDSTFSLSLSLSLSVSVSVSVCGRVFVCGRRRTEPRGSSTSGTNMM
jgi:hypothetical protein